MFTTIDRFCPHSSKDITIQPYCVKLVGNPDNEYAKGKYYIIQVIKNVDDNASSFYCRYGGDGQKNTEHIIFEEGLTEEKAIECFKKKFKEKFGKNFEANDIDVNISYKGYKLSTQ